MKVLGMIGKVLRYIGQGVLNVIALIVGLMLLGLAAGFVLWLFDKSYSSPQGYLVYSLLPLLVISIGYVLWGTFGYSIQDWWHERRRRDQARANRLRP